MSVIAKVRKLAKSPAVQVTVYECRDCGSPVGTQGDSCPDCGGQSKEIHEGEITYEYQY